MARFFQHKHGEAEDGWSIWIHPLPGYKMACCDCGLVHDLEFRLDDANQLNLRARRNNRSTGQRRQHKYEDAIRALGNKE